jgi:hypothetical protein
MNFTFGIITNGNNDVHIKIIIESIEENNIPNYEIIIVGKTNITASEIIRIVDFDETIKPNWITRKKNIVAEEAIYDNIVLLHDYIFFDKNWYNGFLKYGDDFGWCINPINRIDGSRYRDYTLFPYKFDNSNGSYSPSDIHNYFYNNCLLPYDFINNAKINKYMYISGAYYVIKKHIANNFKLDEDLIWGASEDVEISKRLNDNNIIIKCNPFSHVQLLKNKERIHFEYEIDDEMLTFLIDYLNK